MLKPSQSFFVYYIQSKENIFTAKRLFNEKESGGLNKKTKAFWLLSLRRLTMNDPTTSIRKHANELKVCKRTVRTAIEQDLSPDRIPLDYAIWDILEDKTTSHPNIGLLKTASEEEWNKMSEEFILKVLWRQID